MGGSECGVWGRRPVRTCRTRAHARPAPDATLFFIAHAHALRHLAPPTDTPSAIPSPAACLGRDGRRSLDSCLSSERSSLEASTFHVGSLPATGLGGGGAGAHSNGVRAVLWRTSTGSMPPGRADGTDQGLVGVLETGDRGARRARTGEKRGARFCRPLQRAWGGAWGGRSERAYRPPGQCTPSAPGLSVPRHWQGCIPGPGVLGLADGGGRPGCAGVAEG